MMRADQFRKLLRAEPFEPLRIARADDRSVLVRHPDQVVVAERHLLVGLARLERSRPLATPARADSIAKDWLIINLVQVTAIESANGSNGRPRVKRPRR
jgi:hypothetical protein